MFDRPRANVSAVFCFPADATSTFECPHIVGFLSSPRSSLVNFLCLDVETANESAASICQLGIACFIDGLHEPDLDIDLYVDPEDYFLEELMEIHGISEESVIGAPTFPQVHAILSELLPGCVVLGHSHFDRVSLGQATAKYGLPSLTPTWLDTSGSHTVLGLRGEAMETRASRSCKLLRNRVQASFGDRGCPMRWPAFRPGLSRVRFFCTAVAHSCGTDCQYC